MTESDATLVELVRGGDMAAAGTLLRRYFRAAYLVALARVGSRADAEDVCQEAFVRSVDRIAECRDPARFGPWLIAIVRNTAHNFRDHRRVRAAEPFDDHPWLRSPDRPDVDLDRSELRRRLLDALQHLGDVPRDVVVLHDLEGWTHNEIAARLGISVTMSRRFLSDSRRQLRALLKDADDKETKP